MILEIEFLMPLSSSFTLKINLICLLQHSVGVLHSIFTNSY